MQNNPEQLKSLLHGLIQLIGSSLLMLGIKLDAPKIEELSVTIYSVMEARWRKYHSIQHVFSICETKDPIQILAGLFHDLAYLQIDRRIHPRIRHYLPEYSTIGENYSISIHGTIDHSSKMSLLLVNEMFGVRNGQILTPFTGANEYLSALIAARVLEPLLKPWDLIQILACIELTIPFRNTNELGESPVQQLERRLNLINKSLDLHKSAADISTTIKNAVEIANRDVISFSYKEIEKFQINTWQLILEGNPVFKNPMFTISQFRTALLKVEKFYAGLNSKLIFKTCDHPDFNHKIVDQMTSQAESNLESSREYYQIRLITFGLLESIADLSGGDAPLVLFAGQVVQEGNNTPVVVEAFLDWDIPECNPKEQSEDVLKLLNQGLYDALSKDAKKVTISTYLYLRIERLKRAYLFEKSKELFEKKIKAETYLRAFDYRIAKSVIYAVSQMATTRREKIREILKLIDESKAA